MPHSRELTEKEKVLINYMVSISKVKIPVTWDLDNTIVTPMNDGGMGSLYLYENQTDNPQRKIHCIASEYEFIDRDGIPVLCSIYVDENNYPIELDIFKADFNKLISLPEIIP